jgi:MarR family transcriptional regulator for hemolysin
MHLNSHANTKTTITSLLQFSHQLIQYVDSLLMSGVGIGVSQFRILGALQQKPRCTQQELAQTLAQTEASISRQVKILQARHLITIHQRPEDKRARSLVLTPRGRDITESATSLLSEQHNAILAQLSDVSST